MKTSRLIFILGSVVVAAFLASAFWVYGLFTPVSTTPTDPTSFIIPKGQAVSVIGQRLTDAGFIKHPLVFRFVVQQQGLSQKIQAGSFTLSPEMTPFEVAQTLTEGTEDVWITLLEGWRAEEMAEYLAGVESLGAFDEAAFLEAAQAYPGMLYPDTYLVPKGIEAEAVANLLVNTFESRMTSQLSEEIAASSRDFDEVLVMASIVQREARDFEQMRHVAGILWKRIEIGMPLQVDATLQYVKGTPKNWWAVPLAADKQLVSPFNTYLNAGLPPAPISNPGLDAIKATLTPLETDELFYIHAPNGAMYYASTLEGHNANINRYLR